MRALDTLDLSELFDYDTDLWLGFYTEEGLRLALQRYGMTNEVRERGFAATSIELILDEPDEQMLRLWSSEPACEEPLLELVVSRDTLHFQEKFASPLTHPFAQVLNIQWLLMQNPWAKFGPERLPLPGQTHPGLGLGAQVMELLKNSCRRLNLDGMLTVPAHFHNAMMYGDTFRYIDPQVEGAFRALTHDLFAQVHALPEAAQLAAASWALQWKMVRDTRHAGDRPFEWFHQAMVYPISDDMKAYFRSAAYLEEVEAASEDYQFEVFSQVLFRALEANGLQPWQEDLAAQWLAKYH